MGHHKLESAAAACAIPTWAGVVRILIMDRPKLGSFPNCPHSQNGRNIYQTTNETKKFQKAMNSPNFCQRSMMSLHVASR